MKRGSLLANLLAAGLSAGVTSPTYAETPAPVLKVDRVRAEVGGLFDGGDVDSSNYGHAAVSARFQPAEAWEFQLGARVDGYWQTGNPDFAVADLDYAENFVRWRGEQTRVTVGTQNVLWGRTDEMPPTDRLSRVDLSRFALDKLADRRRAVPGIRVEHFVDDGAKLDFFAVPVFDPAVLPDQDSIWNPVDRRDGRIILVDPSPGLAYLVREGRFAEDDDGAGGAGMRLTFTGAGIDFGFSVQRARQSVPYYRIDPTLAQQLRHGTPPGAALARTDGAAFTAVHPYSWVAGGEMEVDALGATWRLEGAYVSDVPSTTTDLRYFTDGAVDWVAGVEFFPGDGDTRATLQVAGHQLMTNEPLVELGDYYSVNGEIEHTFAQGRWRAVLRFNAGLNVRDYYFNPKLSYLGGEPHELYLAAHFFSGEPETAGGFHTEHDMVVLGWQVRY